MMLITFAELSVSFSILRIPYPFLLGALIAVVDVLGAWDRNRADTVGFGEPADWQSENVYRAGVTYVAVTVIRNIIEPRLISHQIGLNPLVTLFLCSSDCGPPGYSECCFPVIVMIIIQLQNSGRIRLWK